MSVDDSKLIRVIEKDEVDIQKERYRLHAKVGKNVAISFNYDKCKVMHFGIEEKNTGAWGTTA
jgi:hypothetical protein